MSFLQSLTGGRRRGRRGSKRQSGGGDGELDADGKPVVKTEDVKLGGRRRRSRRGRKSRSKSRRSRQSRRH